MPANQAMAGWIATETITHNSAFFMAALQRVHHMIKSSPVTMEMGEGVYYLLYKLQEAVKWVSYYRIVGNFRGRKFRGLLTFAMPKDPNFTEKTSANRRL